MQDLKTHQVDNKNLKGMKDQLVDMEHDYENMLLAREESKK